MTAHILAVHSYGSHRVKHPSTKKMVSAHKIGYTSAAADLLLALYGDYARDVSSSRTSYCYIHITEEIPAIRIIKSQASSDEPDAVQTAIQQVKVASVVRSSLQYVDISRL